MCHHLHELQEACGHQRLGVGKTASVLGQGQGHTVETKKVVLWELLCVGRLLVCLGGSGTHLLASLAEANCLVLVDEETTAVPVGHEVPVSFLAQRA